MLSAMSIMTGVYLAILALFSLITVGGVIFRKCNRPFGLVFIFGACLFTASIFHSPKSIVYIVGPKDYVVQKGSVVDVFKEKSILLWKPDGKIRSYAAIRDTFLWKTRSPAFPGMKPVLEAKGTVSSSEEYHAVYDSLQSVLPDTAHAEPMKHLGCGIYPIHQYHNVLNRGLEFRQAVRIKSITFTYSDSLKNKSCEKESG